MLSTISMAMPLQTLRGSEELAPKETSGLIKLLWETFVAAHPIFSFTPRCH